MGSAVAAVSTSSDDYGEGESLVAPHAAQALTFAAGVGIPIVVAARTGRLPRSIPTRDLLLLGIATHKLSRLITRDKVTNFLRAPFTTGEGHGNLNEVNQRPRGRGLRRAMGELLSCPFCAGTWVAGGLVVGWVYAPRLTRALEAVFVGLSVSDFLHIAYARAADSVEGK